MCSRTTFPRIIGCSPRSRSRWRWWSGGGLFFLATASDEWSEEAARSVQIYRDRRAADIHRAVTSEGPFPERLRDSYHLYLRSFESIAHVKVVLKSWIQKRRVLDPDLTTPVEIKGFGRTSTHRRYVVWGDLETLLADRLESMGSALVALGRPGEQVGAGRILTTG